MSALLLALAASGVLLLALAGIIYMLAMPKRKVVLPIGADVHVPLIRNFGPKERERILKDVRDCFANGREYHIWRTGVTPKEANKNLNEEIEARRSIFPPELEVRSEVHRAIGPENREGPYQVEALLTFSARQSVA